MVEITRKEQKYNRLSDITNQSALPNKFIEAKFDMSKNLMLNLALYSLFIICENSPKENTLYSKFIVYIIEHW